ncbi:MAG: hypothetical protein ACKVS9_02075 [Phycisphaerae bacterium]
MKNAHSPINNICRARTVACLLALAAATAAALGQESQPAHYFRIHVIDDQTSRGVPLVELRTTHNVQYLTDSAGMVAFREPGLMDQPVWFFVSSHGYEHPADGFGFRGVSLTPRAGESATIRLKRMNIAERLYRVTGGGIYRDSILLGDTPPIAQPLLNAKVFGQDSVLNAIYRGRLFWMWGDTGRPAYPLGTFFSPGATSLLPADGGLNPDIGIDLQYFTGTDGFARGLAPTKDEGAMWLDALCVLPDDAGTPRMLATFARVRGLEATLERGFMQFNDDAGEFQKLRSPDINTPCYPHGQPLRVTHDGVDYLYFARPFPLTRIKADRAAYLDPSQCETFTCVLPGAADAPPKLDRGDAGRVRFAWRRGAKLFEIGELAKHISAGLLAADESIIQTRDIDTGKPILLHYGSCYWNAWRQRWIIIAVQSMGTSFLGEVWYLEGDSPLGPWVYARKVVTHDKYSFYNPRHHVEFDRDDGRTIYFEGTYATTFSGACQPTPYYDYNQIMYRLSLTDDRMLMPIAYYDMAAGATRRFIDVRGARELGLLAADVRFFAYPRAAVGTIGLFRLDDASAEFDTGWTADAPSPDDNPLLYALAPQPTPQRDDLLPLRATRDGSIVGYVFSVPHRGGFRTDLRDRPSGNGW